jgi:hypothetical protein
MPLHRRDLLRTALLAPVGLMAVQATRAVGAAIAQAAPNLRPMSVGTSATRCAACGATGHSMLDPACPAARRVL